MCVILTPLVLIAVGRLGYRPLPYLLAIALAANVGRIARGRERSRIVRRPAGSVNTFPRQTAACARTDDRGEAAAQPACPVSGRHRSSA